MSYVRELRALVGNRPLILVGSNVLVVDADAHVLLQRRTDTGLWSMIGGTMEPGETLEQVARREAREEVGLELDGLMLIDFFSGPEFHDIYPNGDQVYPVGAVYVGRGRGEPRPDDEGFELRYFPVGALPESLNRNTRLVLQRRAVIQNIHLFAGSRVDSL